MADGDRAARFSVSAAAYSLYSEIEKSHDK
jgi:hypothetical protein